MLIHEHEVSHKPNPVLSGPLVRTKYSLQICIASFHASCGAALSSQVNVHYFESTRSLSVKA